MASPSARLNFPSLRAVLMSPSFLHLGISCVWLLEGRRRRRGIGVNSKGCWLSLKLLLCADSGDVWVTLAPLLLQRTAWPSLSTSLSSEKVLAVGGKPSSTREGRWTCWVCESSKGDSCELARMAVAAYSAGAEDSCDLAVRVDAFPDCNLLKGKAEICCKSKQPGALDAGGRRSMIQLPEGISL